MQIYALLSPWKSIPYYPHANLYPIIPMQISTLLSPWHDNPPFLVLPIFTTSVHGGSSWETRARLEEPSKIIFEKIFCLEENSKIIFEKF